MGSTFRESALSKGRALLNGSAMLKETAPLLDPGRPGLRVLVLLGLLAATVAGIYAWRSQPVAEPLAPPVPSGAGAISADPASADRAGADPVRGAAVAGTLGDSAAAGVPGLASSSPASGVTVHVAGKVRKPGVRTLAMGSRVVDAVQAAGGARAGASLDGINLARPLVDGEQIVVGVPAAPGAPPGTGAEGVRTLSLNSATFDQLQDLPGVGQVLAQRIIEYRNAHGGFQSIEQLQDVSGIGPQRFADLKGRVTP
ncbi:ComEA family DNA-binding protein [Microtetraspora sp. NBRC 16547]|uniref:ComEA family DNA-binding protein n=1 Tax=Microtetraspora sp. NBRC 16547 TaxID=3030993 RepID=UPI0025542EC2|nr:ComEA family DNA-binding protein [Microtetraspora sp. NBRC 16547]